jgi:hypothetical protein
MNLVDRYLWAVRQHLPKTLRDDVAAELKDTLLSQIEDQQAAFGRQLTEEEVVTVLRRYGPPHAVAAGYDSAPQYLIGPAVFPSYIRTVKIVLCVLAVPAIVSVMSGAIGMDGRAISRVAGAVFQWVVIALLNLAGVTLLFARAERRAARPAAVEPWDPMTLPDVPPSGEPAPVARADAIASFVGTVALLVWWLGVNGAVWRWFRPTALPLEWAAIWSDMTPAVVIVLLGTMAREVMAMRRPRMVAFYNTAGLILNVAALFILSRLLQADELVQADGLTAVLNMTIRVSLVVMLLVAVVDAGMGLKRLWHMTAMTRSAATG